MNKNAILKLINRINAHDVGGIIRQRLHGGSGKFLARACGMEGHYPIQKPFLWEIPKTFWHLGQK